MSITFTATSDEGFTTAATIRDLPLEIDATGNDTPNTLETLLGTYVACFVPALRVGAEQRDIGELGTIDFEVEGQLNDDDKLEAISFDIETDAELSADEIEAVVERAESLCKVHDALKSELAASITLNGTTV